MNRRLICACVVALGCGSVTAKRSPGATPSSDAALPRDAAGGDPGSVADASGAPSDRPAGAPPSPADAALSPADACPCTFPHGVGTCVQGTCQLTGCVGAFGDCNRDPADGCEAALDSDERCGSCERRCNGTTEVCVPAGGVAQCTNPAAPIVGLRWEVPCGTVQPDGQICSTFPPGTATCPAAGSALVDRLVTAGGAEGALYDVTLRFRGLVEPKRYLAGSSAGDHTYVGGMPAPTGFNVYALTISSPAQVFYLNADEVESRRILPLDHTKTIRIAGRATVRLQSSDPNCGQVRNCRDVTQPVCTPYLVPGLPPDTGYNGQFIQLDVVTVKRAM
jgi:hypothetical protein